MAFDMHRMLWPVYFLAIIQNAEQVYESSCFRILDDWVCSVGLCADFVCAGFHLADASSKIYCCPGTLRYCQVQFGGVSFFF